MDISKLKKSVAGFALFAMLTSFVSFTGIAQASTGFDDLDSSHYAYDAIMEMVDLGVMTGDADANTVRPDDSVKRNEMATMLVRAFVGEDSLDTEYDYGFTDLLGDWSDVYINTAALYGLMTGTDGAFSPLLNIDRAQGATAAVNAAGVELDGDYEMPFGDVASDAWYYDEVLTAYWYSIVNGMDATTYAPAGELTRGQAAIIISNALAPELREVVTGDDDDDDDDDDSTAALTVTLSDETPAGDSLPNGAVSVAMAAWDFEADGEDVEVDGLVVHQYAISDMESDSAYYLYNGSERLTSSKTINSTSREITFNNLNVEVADGEVVTLTLRMNVGTPTASIEAGFELEDADVVTSDAEEVELDGPLQGDKFTLASTPAAGIISIEKNGTVSDVSIGADEATVAKFKLSPSSESAWVQEIGLYLTGTVSVDDVTNFKLYRTGEDEVLAEVAAPDSNDVVRFVLDGDYESDDTECTSDDVWGYCLSKSATRTFYVTADFGTGRTGDSVKFYVDEDTDLVAVGDTYGYGMSVTRTLYDGGSCTTTAGECAYFDLEGGDITFTKTDYSNTNIATNTEDVAVLNFTIAASSDVTFDNFVLQLQAGSALEATTAASLLNNTTANYTDIKLSQVGGSHVWGPIESDDLLTGAPGAGVAIAEAADHNAAHYIFTDDIEIAAGDEMEFELTLDVENQDALNTDTLTASIFINGTYPIVKDSNNKTLTNADVLSPVSTYAGQEFTLTTNSLTVLRDTNYDDETVVLGAEDIALGAFMFSSGAAGDVEITDLTISAYAGIDNTSDLTLGAEGAAIFNQMVQHVDIYVGSVAEENKLNTTSQESSAAGVISFENLDWTIESGTSETLIVVGDTPANTAYDAYAVKVDLADVSADVVATDAAGSAVTASGDAVQGGVTYTLGTMITFTAGGTLAVDISGSTPVSQITAAGTTGHEFALLKFTATQEDMSVSSFVLRNAYATTAGDYDDDLDSVTVEYFTDAAQTTVGEATCESLTGGYYHCALSTPMVVPNSTATPGAYALLTVVADMASTAYSKADSGDLPTLTLALYEYDTTRKFVAEGADSGRDIEASATYDLAITDVTAAGFSNVLTGYDNLQSAAAITSTSATSILVEDEVPGDPGDINMVGGFLCLSTNDDTTCDAAEEIVYIVAVTDGAASDTLTVVRGVDGTTPATFANDTTILAMAPSSALATNAMYVYESDLTLTATSTRTGVQSATETIMSLTVAEVGSGSGYLRQGLQNEVATDPTEVFAVAADADVAVDAVNYVSTSSMKWTVDKDTADADDIAANDGFLWDAGAADVLNDYTGVTFWVKFVDADAAVALNNADVKFIIDDDTASLADGDEDAFSLGSALAENYWTFFDLTLSSVDAADRYYGLYAPVITRLNNTDTLAIDLITFYKDKLNVDLTLNEAWNSTTPTLAYLKDGSSVTKATAYVDFDASASSSTGQITFVPTGSYSDIEFSGTETYSIQMNTSSSIANGTDTETLTASIDLGAPGGTGDLYWQDNVTAITFCGVDTSDKATTVSSY